MPRSRPWIAALSAVALLFSLAAGPLLGDCPRSGSGGATRLGSVHRSPNESAVADEIYAAFTEANPNITITREAIQTEQMRDTVNTAISSGTGPDIIFYDAGPGYAGVLADAGLLLPLDDYAAEYGWAEEIAAPAAGGDHHRRQALRHASADRLDRHVLQQDVARSGRVDRSHDARRAARLLRRGHGEGLHPDRLRQQPWAGRHFTSSR